MGRVIRGAFLAPALLSCLVGTSLCLAADPPARPAPSSAGSPTEYARSRYRLGVDAFRAGRFVQAIDYFLEADRLAPSAALSFNIAQAYESLGDVPATLRWYRDYLRRAPDAQDRGEVEKAVLGLEAQLAQKGVQQLTVFSDPGAAALSVDGQSRGSTPWTGELPPGKHTLELGLSGYRTKSEELDLPSDHAIDARVSLEAAPEPTPEASAPRAAPAPAGPAAPERPAETAGSGRTMKTVGWIALGAGGAALGGALAFEILRRGAESDAKTDHTQVGYADKLDTMQSRQTTARVLAGVGGALAITGGALLWVGSSKGGSTAASGPRAAFGCGPGACVGTVDGTF